MQLSPCNWYAPTSARVSRWPPTPPVVKWGHPLGLNSVIHASLGVKSQRSHCPTVAFGSLQAHVPSTRQPTKTWTCATLSLQLVRKTPSRVLTHLSSMVQTLMWKLDAWAHMLFKYRCTSQMASAYVQRMPAGSRSTAPEQRNGVKLPMRWRVSNTLLPCVSGGVAQVRC